MNKIEYYYELNDPGDVKFTVTTKKVLVAGGGKPIKKIVNGNTQPYTSAIPHDYGTNFCQFESRLIAVGNKKRTFILTEMDQAAFNALGLQSKTTIEFGGDIMLSKIKMNLTSITSDLSGNTPRPEGAYLFYIGTSDDRIFLDGTYNRSDFEVDNTTGPVMIAPDSGNFKKFVVYFNNS